MKKEPIYSKDELELLNEIEAGEWVETPLSNEEKARYSEAAAYTESLNEKRQTTIRFAVSDLAAVKAAAQELGIGYQNLIQMLVHQYAKGKIKLEI